MKKRKSYSKVVLGLLTIVALFIGNAKTFSQMNPNNSGIETSEKQPGLLILTHGSPSPLWNQAVEELTQKVRAINEERATNGEQKIFHAIEFAHLEFCRPTAAEGIRQLEKQGCDRIIVVPAFVFPTSHSHFDVPAVLGLYSSPSIRQILKEENAIIAQPNVPLTLTQTLYEGDFIQHYVCDEIQKMSQNASNEVLLLIAHGDEGHQGLIDPVMRRLTTQGCGRFGLNEGNWAYCEVGQSYNETVVPLIEHYRQEGKRVLCVGLYLATSAQKINDVGLKFTPKNMINPNEMGHNQTGHKEANDVLMKKNENDKTKLQNEDAKIEAEPNRENDLPVVFSQEGMIKNPEMPTFLFQMAQEAL